MDRERTLEALIERMLSGESLAGPPGAGATPVALRRLEHVFAGFSQARSQPVDDGAIAHAAGEILGTFRLRERIGVGGMGEVWLAERADGAVEQRVAIKFVRDAQARWADRLEHERRLLARLAHPYIARFLDAGRDAGGMPYLVMEYVVGEPVDRWCEAQALDLAGRIDLVLKVCEAVEHAHRQLVVHRDLKPANILVCADGTPRLLDFGIATLIESADDLRMQSESPLLTLAWAAPEQLAGRAVSTATDVHALGLVLFELLCGRLPPARRDGSLAALVDSGRREPPRASGVLEADAPPGWPVRARELRGDGDAILAKALRVEPRERYGSVAELAADLRRWRRQHPVLARAPGRLYRARRFLRRHRLGVAVAVLAIAAMAFGLGIAVWQARLARAEAARADAQSARATRIAEFLTGLVREQDPLRRDRAQARSARELVGEGVLRARSEFADVSDLRASMLGVLGEAMTGLGELEQGRRLLEEARASLPDGSGEAARLDGLLGGIAIDQGRQVEGKALLDAALATLRAGSADDRRAAARIAVRRAFVQHNEGKPEAALAELRAAGSELNEVLGADHPDSLEVETGILAILSQMRRDDEAAPLADALVARIERVGGDHSARLIDPLNYAAQIAKRRADFARSRTLFERAIALAREHKGERNETLAGLYSRIANLHQEAGHADEALASLDAAARALPAGANLERAQMLATRGDILVDLGRFGEAEPALREALRLRRESSGDGDGQVWYSQSEWARALNGLGRHAEALAAQREALARMESIMGGQAYQLTFVLRALAETCEAIGRVDESARLFARAAELAGARYGPFHTVTLQYRTSLASALRHSGDAAGALAEADAILARRDGHAELGVHLARAALIKARVLDGRGEHLAARALARQGLGDLDAAPVDNADTRRDLLELAGPRH